MIFCRPVSMLSFRIATIVVVWISTSSAQDGLHLINDLDLLKPATRIDGFGELTEVSKLINQIETDPYSIDIDETTSVRRLREIESALEMNFGLRTVMARLRANYEVMYNDELRWMHNLLKLKRSEFRKIQKRISVVSLRKSLEECFFHAHRAQSRQAGWVRANSPNYNPRFQIEQSLLFTVERMLSKTQSDLYRTELESRREFRKDATVGAMVAYLDGRLLLSENQRERVSMLLKDQWNEQWTKELAALITHGIEFLNGIPKQDIRNLLTVEQKIMFGSFQWERLLDSEIRRVASQKTSPPDLESELEFAPEDEGVEE